MEHALPDQQLLSNDRIPAILDKRTERACDTPARDVRSHHLPRVPVDDPRACAQPQAGRHVRRGARCGLDVHVRGRCEEGIRALAVGEEAADMGGLPIQSVHGPQRAGGTSWGESQAVGLAGCDVEVWRARHQRHVREGALWGRVALHVRAKVFAELPVDGAGGA